MSRALVLTYHAVEPGPPPLCVEPALLARHLDCIVESGARVLTIRELAEAVRDRRLPRRAVAIAFDDGFASVVHAARPLLAERGLVGTVFCVAGRLGGRSDWPSQAGWAPRLPLADAAGLAGLVREGWEIGSHGLDHDVLAGLDDARVLHDLRESRRLLEAAVGAPVGSFAYPYGVVPQDAARALREAGYRAACTTRVAAVRPGADPFALPRVDVAYLRRPALLRAGLAGRLDVYLAARGAGARARRLARKDYSPGTAEPAAR
jgi:peptidoglycan/xylan/chitin deacetylase (PgdA/CDA1 family)